ncbi:MAG: IS1182 family transposase [Pleurocapsa sp. MO_226.B13]|nr:IS1182 family transposase [Pleurocapsa sp. MO_226.B13]
MRPEPWNPPIDLSEKEAKIVKLIKRAKLFTFLREIRHLLFDEKFQEELSTMYAEAVTGHPPVPPAQLALTVILQAYTKASDAEAIEALTMDRRWQLVVDCLDCEQAPFSQASLVRFRQALIIHQLDRRLIERTVELAFQTKKFGGRQLRAALDSSPLWGAAKVEDTYNLLGHALKKALGVIARQQGRELTEIASEMDADLVAGSSLKAALDLNWENPEERNLALGMVLGVLSQVETHLDKIPDSKSDPVVRSSLEAAEQIKAQDVELDEPGVVKLQKGVAKNRRITIEDQEMRHGRKNRSKRFDGYKRHILKDLDNGLVRAVGVTMANLAEASVTEALSVDLEHQKVQLSELHIDRAYLSSSWVKNRDPELTIYCKAWRVSNGNKFAKSSFVLDWESGRITCPNQVSLPFREGGKVQFPAATCANCPLRDKCTTSKRGRSVSIHPDEKFIAELRERQLTTKGRAKLRERVAVEHSLSHIDRWQGDKARYLGVRKNLFDLRRTAVVHNLHVLLRLFQDNPEQLTSKACLA